MTVISVQEGVRVQEDPLSGQRSLHATKAFRQGDVVSSFAAAEVLSSPTYLSLQKDDDLHITLSPPALQFVNHSCSPSAFFDTAAMQFVTLKDVEAGEELSFFYPSTEWEMAQPFACRCGNDNCLGTIQGAAALPEDFLRRYRLTDFVERKLEERKEKRA